MKKIHEEYRYCLEGFKKIPRSLREIKVGNTVFVNESKCIVTKVEKDCFKVRSLSTNRETYFSKTMGYAMLNFKFRASLI